MSSSTSDTKRFVSADALNELAEDLAFKVAAAGFRPTFIIGLWRGAGAITSVVQEFLEVVQDSVIDNVAVRTSSRDAHTGLPLEKIRVYALGHASATLTPDSRLLICDDVADSGRSLDAVWDALSAKLRANMPREIKIATVFYKPDRYKSKRVPDFYVEATREWLVLPHELVGLSDDEMARFRPHAFKKVQELRALTQQRVHSLSAQ